MRLDVLGEEIEESAHARGQVAHVDLERISPAALAKRLRRILPGDISLRRLTEAPEGFDARFSALERRYVYRLDDRPGVDPLHRGHVVAWAKPLCLPRWGAPSAGSSAESGPATSRCTDSPTIC